MMIRSKLFSLSATVSVSASAAMSTLLTAWMLVGSTVHAEFVEVSTGSRIADDSTTERKDMPKMVASSLSSSSSNKGEEDTTTTTNNNDIHLCGMSCPEGSTCEEVPSPWGNDDLLYLCMICPSTTDQEDDPEEEPQECTPYYNPYDLLHAQTTETSKTSSTAILSQSTLGDHSSLQTTTTPFSTSSSSPRLFHSRHRRTSETTLCALGDGDDASTLSCYHGGKCVDDHSAWIGNLGDTSDALCDCSTAGQMVNGNLTLYTGKKCEIPIVSEDYCTRDIDLYCVNGGTCRGEAANFQQKPCKCPEGYTGRHCEYDEDLVQECILDCNDHGTCQHGMNSGIDQGANKPLGIPGVGTMDFMHCQCNDGYAGTTCEYDYIECDGRGRYCYHGSTCGTPDANGISVCECSQDEDFAAAGDLCEYRRTDTCANPPAPANPSALTQDMAIAKANFPFCVNNGKCVQKPNEPDLYYCECAPNEYEGKRCEKVAEPTLHPAAAPVTPEPTAEATTWEPTAEASETWEPTAEDTTWEPTVDLTMAPSADVTIDSSEAGTDEFLNEALANPDPDGGKLETEAVIVVVIVVLASFSVLAFSVYRYTHNQREFDTAGGAVTSAVKEEDEIVFPPPEEPRNFELTSTTSSQSAAFEVTGNGGLEPVDLNDTELV